MECKAYQKEWTMSKHLQHFFLLSKWKKEEQEVFDSVPKSIFAIVFFFAVVETLMHMKYVIYH